MIDNLLCIAAGARSKQGYMYKIITIIKGHNIKLTTLDGQAQIKTKQSAFKKMCDENQQ
jgi:hypothetical protein